jgi:hypothetical protein
MKEILLLIDMLRIQSKFYEIILEENTEENVA